MIPPNPSSDDPLGFSGRVSDAITAAAKNSGFKNIVALSSVGADKTSGTGPVLGLHNLEQKLNQLDNANILFLRAGYFMENALPQATAIAHMGFAVGPFRPDLKLPMIATRDIGTAAADALLHRAFRGRQIQELHGQRDLNYNEVAAVIGKAIGRPDLKYKQISDDQVRSAMVQMGMSAKFAELLVEMAGALNSGEMKFLEPRNPGNTTATSFESFVSESFVAAYKQQSAA